MDTSRTRAKKKTTEKKRASGQTKKTVPPKKPTAEAVDISTRQAAAKFLAVAGDAETAVAAVKQVQSLQID